jgi:glycosyltransferase involved in cell wall biosynthesis
MPVLYFDTTKARRQSHHSGLNRVSARLLEKLAQVGAFTVVPVHWSTLRRSYVESDSGRAVGEGRTEDAFFTPEVFALRERPFARRWLARFRGRSGVMFHDAIPFFHPEITWPRSVRRFPHWFRDLGCYDTVHFVSGHSREEAGAAAEELGEAAPHGPVLSLGADYAKVPLPRQASEKPVLLNVGILEPRKGQDCLMTVCDQLWMQGFDFKLVFLGRVNPHYGRPLVDRIRLLQQAGRDLVHEDPVDDDRLAWWHQRASLTVLPSRAEGFGLPVLEALWAGCPVVASDQPSVDTLVDRGGIRLLEEVSEEALEATLHPLLENTDQLEALGAGVRSQQLPTWMATAAQLARRLDLPLSS